MFRKILKLIPLSARYSVDSSDAEHVQTPDSLEHSTYSGLCKFRRICSNWNGELRGPREGSVVLSLQRDKTTKPLRISRTLVLQTFASQFNDPALPERDGLKSLQVASHTEEICQLTDLLRYQTQTKLLFSHPPCSYVTLGHPSGLNSKYQHTI